MTEDQRLFTGGRKWLPEPRCENGHMLEEKVATGSWFQACKCCTKCGISLGAGTMRHSCKTCNFHFCTKCRFARAEEMLREEVTLTLYRPAQPGLIPGLLPGTEEDAWQVTIERGATVGELKARVAEVYEMHRSQQVLRRDVDSAPLADDEPLACDDAEVLFLSAAGGMSVTGGPLGLFGGALDGQMASLAEAFSGAIGQVVAEGQAMRESLEREEYTLHCVMPVRDGATPTPQAEEERRCEVVVMALACVSEVLEMVKLEMCAEGQALALEFAGEVLPPHLSVHSLGLRSGDTILVVVQGGST